MRRCAVRASPALPSHLHGRQSASTARCAVSGCYGGPFSGRRPVRRRRRLPTGRRMSASRQQQRRRNPEEDSKIDNSIGDGLVGQHQHQHQQRNDSLPPTGQWKARQAARRHGFGHAGVRDRGCSTARHTLVESGIKRRHQATPGSIYGGYASSHCLATTTLSRAPPACQSSVTTRTSAGSARATSFAPWQAAPQQRRRTTKKHRGHCRPPAHPIRFIAPSLRDDLPPRMRMRVGGPGRPPAWAGGGMPPHSPCACGGAAVERHPVAHAGGRTCQADTQILFDEREGWMDGWETRKQRCGAGIGPLPRRRASTTCSHAPCLLAATDDLPGHDTALRLRRGGSSSPRTDQTTTIAFWPECCSSDITTPRAGEAVEA